MRQRQLWCGEGMCWVSPFVLQLCSITPHSLLLLLSSSSLLFINAQILGFLWSTFFWYCWSGLVRMKCLDFQNVSVWMQQSIFSLFPVNTVTIGKHEQRAKTLVRITRTFKKGLVKLLCFISQYLHYVFVMVCAKFLVWSCIFYTFCKIATF